MAKDRISSLEKFFVLYAGLVVASLCFGGYLFLSGKLTLLGIGLLIFILAGLVLVGRYVGTLAYNMQLSELQAEVSVVIAQLNPEKDAPRIGFTADPVVSTSELNEPEEYQDDEEGHGLIGKIKRPILKFKFRKH